MLRKMLLGTFLVLPLMGALAACDDKGPAEEAGEKIDDAAQSMKDAIDPPGAAEEMGRKIDDAVETE